MVFDICQIHDNTSYVYHGENIINISNVIPILIVGCNFVVVSDPGIFLAQVLRQNWGGGLNVNTTLGSRLSKNQGTFSDYHMLVAGHTPLIGGCKYHDSYSTRGIMSVVIIDENNLVSCYGSRLSKN